MTNAALHPRKRRRGAAAAEFAMVLPIFLLLAFGIVELGRALMVNQIITNGAREGARYAIIPGRTEAQVHAVLDTYFSNTGITGYTRTISPKPELAASGAPLTVTVSVPFSSVSWGTNWLGLDASTFTATVVTRKE